MAETIPRLMGCISVVLVTLLSAWPAGAEPLGLSAKPTLTAETAVPTEEEVRRVIHKLDSVRDFERLHWTLTAIDQQVPPVRAELLTRLDEQVQELIRNEVELRTATALTSLGTSIQQITPGQPERTEHARVAQHPEQAEALQEEAWLPQPTPEHPRAYVEVKDEITHAEFTMEPQAAMEQFRQLSQAIMAVPDAQQREELRTLLHEQRMEAAKTRLGARHAEAEASFSSLSASAQESPETNAQD